MRLAVALSLLALVGCSPEPSFDERYEKAQTSIRDQARTLDADLKQRAQQSDEADDAAMTAKNEVPLQSSAKGNDRP